MEDDDEFGDLYTDVLRPLTTSFQSHPAKPDVSKPSQSRPIERDGNSDDEEILCGAPDLKNKFSNSNQGLGLKLNASIQDKTLAETGVLPERGGLDLNSEAPKGAGGDVLELKVGGMEKGEGVEVPEKGAGGLNFMEDDDDLNIVVEERDNKDDDFVEKDVKSMEKQVNVYSAAEQNESLVDFMGAGAVGEVGTEEMIPGLSGKLENQGAPNPEDDWDSDESEDDLQIVLNDNHGQMGMERMAPGDDEDDEEGEPLVIVADNGDLSHRHQLQPMMMEDPDWVPEEGGSGADGERKELGDAKASGGGSTAAPLAVQPKIGYSNHLYHHPYHSQYKYVRPGTTPMPAPVPPGGTQSQARPPINMGPMAGRGRGDWRPVGVKGAVPMQKGHPGYGMPVWGANTAGRGYGSGLDFTLPSHKTIFEVDIDGFEEKPWRLPGVDVSDFFNFGLNEESWKGYCKHLEQLRLETTMQSKIRVYESGRAEQDYDPDLPPELAAAVGIQDIPSEMANSGRADAGATDARGSARGRPPVQPIGRPIPVETGSGERPPSIDTRRPRMQDSDAIIVIVCQSSTDDEDVAEQQDDDQVEEDVIDDLQQEDADRTHRFSRAYNGQKREPVARQKQLKNTVNRDEIHREDDMHVVSQASGKYHPDREIGLPYEERSAKGRGPKTTASGNSGEKQIIDDQHESFGSERGKRNPHLSSSGVSESNGEGAVAVVDDVNDTSVVDDRSFDTERENMALDETNNGALEDGKLTHSTKLSREIDDREDSKTARSSENSKARSGSSKDYRKSHDTTEDEVLQDRHYPHVGSNKRPVGDEDNFHTRSRHGRGEIRKHVAVKDREDSYSQRGGDPNYSLQRHMKSDSTEWRKESDMTEGSWRRRDEDRHGRRIRVEDTRKREHGGDISSRNRGKARESERGERDEHNQPRNQLDSSSLRGSSHDQVIISRQRERGDSLKPRIEKSDDLLNKRRREGTYVNREHAEKEEITYNHRESSSRRKREREDISDQRKTDDYAKLKDEDMRYVRQKEEGLLQKEKGERQRDRDEWHRHKQSHEEILPRREREETRPVVRSGRPVEDKTWTSHSRGKDDYKGSGREYLPKDIGRHSDQLKRRDRVENESFSHHKGHEDVYERGSHGSSDEKRARYERLGTGDERATYASDTSRLHERRQKEGSRQRESESQDPSSLISSKRNEHERNVQISETANSRGRAERGSIENDIHGNRHSSRKHGEEGGSSDDEQSESRRGRSKLERWTSHKERDFGITPVPSSSLKKNKDIDYNSGAASLVTRIPEESSSKVEGNPHPPVDNKDTGGGGGETNNANTKAVEDKHLDTVEKLKKRSERFKLPMPSEKEAVVIKKMESEALPSGPTETRPDSEIKSERPPRKRRWTGN
ncbi:hypothetical protein ACS0TY_021588 [Phlomoides rotata]